MGFPGNGISHMLSQPVAGELRVSCVTPCERTPVAWPCRAPSPLLGPISGPGRYPEHNYVSGLVSLPGKSLNLGWSWGPPTQMGQKYQQKATHSSTAQGLTEHFS